MHACSLCLSVSLSHSQTHTHKHIQAPTTVKICPSSVSEGFIQPCPSFPLIYYNSIFPVFQSKDLFLLIFNNVQAREACPWEIMWSSLASRLDYIRGT